VPDLPDLPDLRTHLGAAPLVRDVVVVRGPEAVPFLQGQLSQDVAGLALSEPVRAFLLEPTGKVDAWLRVTLRAEDDVLLDVDVGYGPAVLARLQRFRLRTKVDLEVETWSGLALRGPGARDVEPPAGLMALDAAWPGVPSVDLLGSGELALAGVPPVPAEALEALRIECGVPAMGAELTKATIPAEAGSWLVEASVSFTKGCYTGQELVARIDSRGGQVPRPLRGLRLAEDGVPAGAELHLAEAGEADRSAAGEDGENHAGAGEDPSRPGAHAVGTVTSVGRSPALGPVALAVVARSVPVGATVDVCWHAGAVPATVTDLPMR
jgi:tRNA-modifying protein YgfZ